MISDRGTSKTFRITGDAGVKVRVVDRISRADCLQDAEPPEPLMGDRFVGVGRGKVPGNRRA